MPLHIEGKTYLKPIEAYRRLGICKDTFYKRVRQNLTSYHIGVYKRPYFLQEDVDKFSEIKKN